MAASVWFSCKLDPPTTIGVDGPISEAAMEALMTGLAEAHNRNVTAAAIMVYDDQT